MARYKRDFCEEIYLGAAKFGAKAGTIEIDGGIHGNRTIHFKRAMIATGASASIPPVPGLAEVDHLTNSNLFNLTELPPRITVIGAGPIGMEIAQAMQRLGAQVTVLEIGPRFLPREDPDAAAAVQASLESDGVRVMLGVKISKVDASQEGFITKAPFKRYSVFVESTSGVPTMIESEALLNGTGRLPNVHGLDLDSAGVKFDSKRGVVVDEYYQTTNSRIYACGDVASAFKFTHAADWSARLAIRNLSLIHI